jgi:two-component system phosphate regulon response regulator PhoB
MAQQKKVLVADDEPHILNGLSLRLRNAGYQVLMARDGREALETAQQEHPDLVITDYSMPLLSGVELCQRLRRDPRTRDIPAIMLTASGYDVAPGDLRKRGVERRLAKPFNPRELLASVSEVLEAALPA